MFHKFGLRFAERDVEDFIFSYVKQTLREKKFVRKDFLQLLIQLKYQGYVSADKGEEESEADSEVGRIQKINIDRLAANAFIFYLAGEFVN